MRTPARSKVLSAVKRTSNETVFRFIDEPGLLSVLYNTKNRSRNEVEFEGKELTLKSFKLSLESVISASCNRELAIEVVIVDWASDDWPLLEWVPDLFSVAPVRRMQIIKASSPTFSRGLGRNIAASYSKGEVLFFLDSDVVLSEPSLLRLGYDTAKAGKVYSPIVLSESVPPCSDKYSTSAGTSWRRNGKGCFFISRQNFDRVGRWKYSGSWRGRTLSEWGYEDVEYFSRIGRTGITIVREKCPGLVHKWHPADKEWKDKEIFKC